MVTKIKKPFQTLAVHYEVNRGITSVFGGGDELGSFVDPYCDTLKWGEFSIYGVPDTEENFDKVSEGDFTSATKIGNIYGCHIPLALIINLDEDPYTICDDEHADLEAMYSALREHEIFEEAFIDNLYYIHEVELKTEFQDCGYELQILLQLPSIIVKSLNVFPDLLVYYPRPLAHGEPERDLDAEAILAHRIEYNAQILIDDATQSKITFFPPKRDVPEKEINRFLGRRNTGDKTPEAYRNQSLYKLYKSAGFQEAGQSGWLYKRVGSIYTKDGLNR